jgi:hypothetical protein
MHEDVPKTPEQASRNNFTVSVYGISALETNSSAIPSNLERRGGGIEEGLGEGGSIKHPICV